MEELHQKYGDKVEFLAVYVREAHPTDGWRMESNDKVGISFVQPRKLGERTKLAKQCCSTLEIRMPVLVDDMNDRVGHLYSGMPDRLYIIDKDGRVAYKGGRGPFGFKAREMEQSLVMLLLEQIPTTVPTRFGIPILGETDTWKSLPPVVKGAGQPLPLWARVLARSLPRTTAAMLELDYLHRAKSPLDPKLRGQMRWVAAHANGCAYTEAQAAADLRRAGQSDADLQRLAGDWAKLPPAERAALTFARKMTVQADSVTDAEVAYLTKVHGEKAVVAMVLLLAYANFQDRLCLSLGLPAEANGALPPLEVQFAKAPRSGTDMPVPPRISPNSEEIPDSLANPLADPEWLAFDYEHLQQQLEGQRARPPRIRVPSWEAVSQLLPADYPRDRPVRIRWSLVCMGYQPELALGWGACMRAFAREANQDRVFEETLFWVVTRTLHCFY